MPVLLENPQTRLTYYPEHRLFESTILGDADGEQFRTTCDAALTLAAQVKPRLWLTDNQLMSTLPVLEQEWLAHHFMPRFANLPVARAAIVYSQHTLSRLALDAALDRATPHISWQERSFSSYTAAWWWLINASRADWPVWELSNE